MRFRRRGILRRMRTFLPRKWVSAVIAASLLVLAVGAAILRSSALQGPAGDIEKEIAAIRGLTFKHPVTVRQLSPAQARDFVERETVREPEIEDYWAVKRMVGLYQGPDLGPLRKIMGDLAGFAAGAYDSYTNTLFQFDELTDHEQRVLFVHELYHGLQNQTFDLRKYLVDRFRTRGSNEDENFARQAVVEGEALYVETIYQLRLANDPRPMREQLAGVVASQSEWNPAKLDEAVRNPKLEPETRVRLQRAIEAHKRLPPFVFENFLASYFEGMNFIHVLHAKGWAEIEKLYRDYPPVSTEQILHPEKWFAREAPVDISWPAFGSEPFFADWKLLHENVLGERQWRIVLLERGFDSLAKSASAGWGGDRYAVFRHARNGEYLILILTTWDTPEDATEFAGAYQRLLANKYRDPAARARLHFEGNEVLIVEGAAEAPLDVFMEFNRRALLLRR
jgi:hypothetical protein